MLKIRALQAAYGLTSQGDWEQIWDGVHLPLPEPGETVCLGEFHADKAIENAKFVALVHEMLPALVSAVEALEIAEGIVAHAKDNGRPVDAHLLLIQKALARFK